ncbi:MAG: TolC family protein [Campylobacterota bacterium]|nr:TolC family protein [Campylobacterota bacterium]
MQKILLSVVFTTSVLMASQSLSELIEAAHQNELVDVYVQKEKGTKLSRESLKAAYMPRIDLGASGSFVDEKGTMDVGESYTAYATASVLVFDGFKRENALDELRSRINASSSDLKGYKKALSLEVTQAYFRLLNVYGDIEAQEQSKKQLQEELKRQKRFLSARIVTEEEVERIHAALANTEYEIATLQYSADKYESMLYTLSGIKIDALKESQLSIPKYKKPQQLDSIQSLRHQSDATRYLAEQSTSSYYPSLSVQDTYGFYDYQNYSEAFPIDRVDKQNRLMVVASMNLFDFFSSSKQKQSIMAQQQALSSQIAYEEKRSNANIALSKKAIERSYTLLDAANVGLSASLKTFEAIEKKYRANIVDYVKYLDALYQKSNAQAQLNRAENALQLAYAQYYYYAGFDIKEYVR